MKGIIDLNGDLKERKQVVVIIETLVYLLIITFTVIGNSCVLLAVYKNARLRTIPNFFIVILAVSDILLPLTCAPQSIEVVSEVRCATNVDCRLSDWQVSDRR